MEELHNPHSPALFLDWRTKTNDTIRQLQATYYPTQRDRRENIPSPGMIENTASPRVHKKNEANLRVNTTKKLIVMNWPHNIWNEIMTKSKKKIFRGTVTQYIEESHQLWRQKLQNNELQISEKKQMIGSKQGYSAKNQEAINNITTNKPYEKKNNINNRQTTSILCKCSIQWWHRINKCWITRN